MRWGFAGAIAVVLVGWAIGARAQGTAGARLKVAVIRPEVEGNVPDAAREILTRRLREGLGAAEFEVSGDVSAERCMDAACYASLARNLGVTYLVAPQVKEAKKSYDIALDLIAASTGATIGSTRERCEICGIEDAAEKMGLAASALRARLEEQLRMPARFVIRSRPQGATVHIDARAMGRTPIDAVLPGGEHHLTISADGYDLLDRDFTVVNGVDETLQYDLVRLPTKFPFKTAGWTGVAVGALAVAAGAWALAIDSHQIGCSAAERDKDGDCPRLHDTKALGAVLMGAGAVSATLGGVWLYLGSARGGLTGRQSGQGPATTAAVGISGRF
jgi:hypothetical protein